MENLINQTSQEKEKIELELERRELFMTISIHRANAVRLKNLEKGSYDKAISYLLGNKADNSVKLQIEELENRIYKIEEVIEKLIKFNKLHI